MGLSRTALLAGASALAIVVGMAPVNDARAALCVSPFSGTTGVSCNWNSGDLTNTGTISGSGTAAVIANPSGGTLTNSGTISDSGGGKNGITNTGSIGLLNNTTGGTLSGGSAGIYNFGGTIATLINSSAIVSDQTGISNFGSIGSLNNTIGGTISGNGNYGIYNGSTITTLTNSGIISSASGVGINNAAAGTITTLINNSGGTISGATYAINNSGSIGAITNSGVIAGDITNSTANALTINGGSGSTFGLLTGYNSGTPSLASPGTVGAITHTSADLTFASGNLLLNDNIDVTGHTVINSGATLKLVNPITITGAYSQTGGGLVSSITSSTSYGYFTVSGNAGITNTAITISGSGLTQRETFTIVRAGSMTNSTAGDTVTIVGTSGLTGTVTIVGNNLEVVLSSVAYTGTGNAAGGAAGGMGSAIDAVNSSTSPTAVAFQNTVVAKLSALPTASQGAAIKQLAPIQSAPSVQSAGQSTAPTTSVIEQHELALEGAGGVGAAAGSGGHDNALWGQVLGGGALRGTTAAADGYRTNNFGLVFGFDHQATPDLVVGIGLSWVRGWSWGVDNSSGSFTTTNSYQVTGYGLQRWGPAFVDGQVGVGYNTYDQRRSINFLGADAHAKYDGEQYLGKIGFGYDVKAADVTLTPLAGLRFLRAVSGGYAETGAGSGNLTVDRRGVQSLTQDVGAKLSWKAGTVWGTLIPEARVAWVHDYTHGPIASSGVMGGSTFISQVSRPSADGMRVNLAATLETKGDTDLRLEYEGEDRHDYQSHTGLLKATWAF